jgi:hypothetical protein
MSTYMKAARRFKETLFVLVNLSGVAPARGMEPTLMQYENSPEGTAESVR